MGPHIFQTCPSANYFDCKAMSIGARSQSARTYLERCMDKFADCETTLVTSTSTLAQGGDVKGVMEISICVKKKM